MEKSGGVSDKAKLFISYAVADAALAKAFANFVPAGLLSAGRSGLSDREMVSNP
jgi:hypothetical protein